MVGLTELVDYCDTLLGTERFKDYCPNGLQVEGRSQVVRLISGVTACRALLEAAVEANADAVLVHHGYFWKNEAPTVTGVRRRRIKLLLDHDISLLGYHLPLDAHPEFGNNASLARKLNWRVDGILDAGPGRDILFHGRLPAPMSLSDLSDSIGSRLGSRPLAIAASDSPVSSLAWCTGAAQSLIEEAAALGVDAYVSGEISEQTTHLARESGIHFIAAGHHATERYGVQALGAHLAERFDLKHQFIDIANPV